MKSKNNKEETILDLLEKITKKVKEEEEENKTNGTNVSIDALDARAFYAAGLFNWLNKKEEINVYKARSVRKSYFNVGIKTPNIITFDSFGLTYWHLFKCPQMSTGLFSKVFGNISYEQRIKLLEELITEKPKKEPENPFEKVKSQLDSYFENNEEPNLEDKVIYTLEKDILDNNIGYVYKFFLDTFGNSSETFSKFIKNIKEDDTENIRNYLFLGSKYNKEFKQLLLDYLNGRGYDNIT